MRLFSVAGAAVVAATFGLVPFGLALESAQAASAVQKECSEKYQAAKSANTLAGMTYNQFYSQCAAAAKGAPTATAAPAVAPAAAGSPPQTKAELKAEKKAEKAKEKAEKKEEKERENAEKKGLPAPTPTAAAPTAPAPSAPAPAAPAPTTTAARPASVAPMAAGNAVFPSAISATYAKETAGKARMHTCLAQYNANKTSNGNGGLKWIEKGGGYYSECNKRLKG